MVSTRFKTVNVIIIIAYIYCNSKTLFRSKKLKFQSIIWRKHHNFIVI